jgi:leucyl-tRNA synthetase
MVLNHIFSRRTDKGGIEYFAPEEVEMIHDASAKVTGAKALKDGLPVDFQGMGTMSKSKLNGVDPQSLIEQYGADTARLFMMFAAPPEQTLEWSDSGVEGAHRFLKRVWNFGADLSAQLENSGLRTSELSVLSFFEIITNPVQRNALRNYHLLLKQANYDLERKQFNTVVSAGMKLLNVLEKEQPSFPHGNLPHISSNDDNAEQRLQDSIVQERKIYYAVLTEGFSILLRLLSPICPHITHTLWRELGYGDDILAAAWPEPLAVALEQDEIELVIQVNGKLRGNIRVAKDADKATLEQLALAHEVVQKHLAGAVPKKIVIVPGRLINIVA